MMKLLIIILSYLLILNANASIDEKLVKSANEKLKTLNQTILHFTQKDSKKNLASGSIFISKPGRFRCQYDSGVPLLIVGNDNTLYLYDYNLEQYSYDKVDKNGLFSLLTINNLQDIPSLTIESTEKFEDYFTINFNDKERNQKIALSFSNKNDSILESLVIEEVSKNVIEIKFNKVMHVKNFANHLFCIKNPKIFGPPKKAKPD